MPLAVCVIAFGAICAACGSDTKQTNLVHSEHISKDFHEIWLDGPDGPAPKVNASDFDAEGHKLCDMNK